MKYPEDSVQFVPETWWEKSRETEPVKGSLIYAFVPHVDQVPHTLKPLGRKDAANHHEAKIEIAPLAVNAPRQKEPLPVAALSLSQGELWAAYRAKKRPCLVLKTPEQEVKKGLRIGMSGKATAPTYIVAPYYGADKDGKRAGYNQELVERICHAEYPQFMVDFLPLGGPVASILRFDHIQPIGLTYKSYENTGYVLSEEAVSMFLDDWFNWFFYGGLPEDSLLYAFKEGMKEFFG